MPSGVFDSILLKHVWGTDALRAVFNDENRVQKWFDFEAALAIAQAELGIVPQAAADEIFFGKDHPVDSSEAALRALQERLHWPRLLEPTVHERRAERQGFLRLRPELWSEVRPDLLGSKVWVHGPEADPRLLQPGLRQPPGVRLVLVDPVSGRLHSLQVKLERVVSVSGG